VGGYVWLGVSDGRTGPVSVAAGVGDVKLNWYTANMCEKSINEVNTLLVLDAK